LGKKYADFTIEIQHYVLRHLQKLKDVFNRYFPECEVDELPGDIQENIIELQNDRNCKVTFESGVNVDELWFKRAIVYPNLREIELRYLLMFSIILLIFANKDCFTQIKNKQRTRLNDSKDMLVALGRTTDNRTIMS
ncbi:Hypothetical protein CINCED_3A025526, partial [Cinara cedri]